MALQAAPINIKQQCVLLQNNSHIWLDAAATEDVSAVDDRRIVHDLFADEAFELVSDHEEPLTLSEVEVEILLRFFGQAL